MDIILDHFAKKILLIRSDRLGDLLAITPAIRAVRSYFKDARIDFLASDINVEAIRVNPHIDNVYVLKQRGPLSWPRLVWQIRRQNYDIVLCFNGGSSKAALFTWLAGAGTSFGKVGIGRKFSKYFDHFFIPDNKLHITRANLAFLGKFGIPSAGEKMEFVLPDDARKNAATRFPRSERKRLAVFIGNAKKIHSRWPAEKFAVLVEKILATYGSLEIFLLYGKAEIPLLSYFKPHDRLKMFNGNLVEAAAFLATCDALLTSSSGPWHLAAAVDTPTMSIISRFNYDFWRPLEGRNYFVVQDDDQNNDDVRTIKIEPVLKMVEDFITG